jgi:putative zinc finger/helix-turn-helix YgiT family protein
MICLRCDSEDFAETPNAVIEQEFRGELFRVESAAQTCTMCGWVTVTPTQADELRRRTADAYRKKHGLLTSEEIRAMRRAMGKNQRDFAEFLDVGEASVKRWETWQVQDKSSDRLIRLKCLASLYEAAVEATKQTYISVADDLSTSEWKGTKPAMGLPEPAEAEARLCAGKGEQESQTQSCDSRFGPTDGWSPPTEMCDEVALSLSAPCRYSFRALKKKMQICLAE